MEVVHYMDFVKETNLSKIKAEGFKICHQKFYSEGVSKQDYQNSLNSCLERYKYLSDKYESLVYNNLFIN